MKIANLPLPRLCLAVLTAVVAAIRGLASRASSGDPPRVGSYLLGARIGQGGMGEVYRARHVLLDRDVAIKRLSATHDDDAARSAFAREVRLTSRLRAPSIIAVHDCGYDDEGRPYYTMELAEGSDLELLVRRQGPLPAGRVIRLLQQICDALDEVHRLGIVHRDVKPANLVLDGGIGDRVKLLDFGLAVDLAAPREITSAVLGTPAYLAPESILAPASVDARTDLYGLGAVGYWLLTGTDVFLGSSVVELCSHHVHAVPEPLSRRLGARVPADLEAVILRCLAKDPGARYESAQALRAALEACASGAEVVVGLRRVDRSDAGAAAAARAADGRADDGPCRLAFAARPAVDHRRSARDPRARATDVPTRAVERATTAAGQGRAVAGRLAGGGVRLVATGHRDARRRARGGRGRVAHGRGRAPASARVSPALGRGVLGGVSAAVARRIDGSVGGHRAVEG